MRLERDDRCVVDCDHVGTDGRREWNSWTDDRGQQRIGARRRSKHRQPDLYGESSGRATTSATATAAAADAAESHAFTGANSAIACAAGATNAGSGAITGAARACATNADASAYSGAAVTATAIAAAATAVTATAIAAAATAVAAAAAGAATTAGPAAAARAAARRRSDGAVQRRRVVGERQVSEPDAQGEQPDRQHRQRHELEANGLRRHEGAAPG
jgi:hypothetical protein